MIPRLFSSKKLALLSLTVLLLALTACQAAAVETTSAPVPTAAAADAYPAEALAAPNQSQYEAYPAEAGAAAEAPATDPNTGYPAAPMGVAAIENNSKITARLVSITPDAADPAGFTRVQVVVLSSEAIPGMQSFTSELVDQELELLVEPVNLPELAAGDTFAAEVEYRGDESGGMYFAKNLTKINP
jgi:hypothetical protein